jgi:phenylacetate-CoA ligase
VIIVVGEIRTEDDKKQIGEMFGAEVRDVCRNEMGFIGSECPYGEGCISTVIRSLRLRPGTVVVSNGESGMLVTTDLHRKKMPIINYRTGDITEGLVYEECPCGRKSPKMKRILGRVGDIPRVKGMFIPPRRVELVISKHKNLCGYQLLIDRPEKRSFDDSN